MQHNIFFHSGSLFGPNIVKRQVPNHEMKTCYKAFGDMMRPLTSELPSCEQAFRLGSMKARQQANTRDI